MSNSGWIDTFTRVNWENVDGKFATNVMTVSDEVPSRTEVSDLRFISNDASSAKVYHNTFAIMTRYISNYVFYQGTTIMYTYWDESMDAEVAYLEANITADETIKKCLRYDCLTQAEFDWDNRVIKLHHDASLRPRDEWIPEDKFWAIDGLPTGYESSDSANFEGTCIVAKELYSWNTQSCHISPANSMVYNKPADKEAYVFVYVDDVEINGTPVVKNTCLRITSSAITITATGTEAVVVIKEKK
jgi:hypothetical protein